MKRMRLRGSMVPALAVATLAGGALSGCSAAAMPSAAPEPSPPAVLTFAFTHGFADPQVAALQGAIGESGSLQLAVSGDFDTQFELGVEQAIVRAVAAGGLDLGLVGARAFSELGVHDFDALVAPFAIDSLQTQQAVLDSDLPARMLAGLDELSVVGLAVVGGPLRRPAGAGEAPVTLADFSGLPFYSFHGDVPAASIAALGAVNVNVSPEERNLGIEDGSIRGYENGVGFLAQTADFRVNAMAANVNLWPSIGVLVVSPAALDRLTPAQGQALREAARQTAASALDIVPDEAALALEACDAGARFATATADDLARLRDAVTPVLEQLRSDETTARHLDEIAVIRGTTPPDAVAAPSGCLTE